MALRPKPTIRGWCPGAWRPMHAGDGLLVRVRPRAGRLTTVQATGIAMLADRHGNGSIDLTGRANLQMRGVDESGYPLVIDGLCDLGLLDRDADAEARRNIIVTPFWQAGDEAIEVAEALAVALTSVEAPVLPAKFGFAVDCCDVAVLRSTPADIRIERGPPGLIVRAGGLGSVAVGSVADAVRVAMTFANHSADRTVEATADHDSRLDRAESARVGKTPRGFLAGIEFGQLTAGTLAALAALGPLRMTPWRMLLIEGVVSAPALEGVIRHADDPLLRVVACVGSPRCTQGFAATRPLARTLAPHVAAGTTLHVSGCAKGCAHQGDATTLVATPDGFDLVRKGRASSPADIRSLSPDAVRQLLERTIDALPV